MLKLYPIPKKINVKKKTYILNYANIDAEYSPIELICVLESKKIQADSRKMANISYIKKETLPKEAYELTIDENGIKIFYSFDNGAFYATQTLCQIIDTNEIPYLEIFDEPALKYRALSVDISRGKIPKMNHFKEIIENIAAARYNVFSLYLDDLVIQLPSFDKYWKKDAITLNEINTIKKWCNDKFIQFSISIETFGHLNKFIKIDEFRHLSNSMETDNIGGDLNPLDPESINFVDMLMGDVVPLIDTEFIVIGGDEIVSLKTGKSKIEVDKKGEIPVYMEYINKVCNLANNKYHKKPILNNDVFMKRNAKEFNIIENLKLFPIGTIIGDWGYESEYEYHTFEKNSRLFKKMNIPFMTMASTGLYNQYVPRSYNMVLNALNSCYATYKNNGIGAWQTTWGDAGNSQYMVMEYEGIYVFGATAWNPLNFEFSYVLKYLDKYIFKSENESMAECVAKIGDAAWYSKGKFPDTNAFCFADSCSFENGNLYNCYHAHAGIDSINIWDALDVYGCEKAILHVEKCKKEISDVKINCENSDLIKEKILLNVTMFEVTIKSGYLKLCILHLNDFDKAKQLFFEINAGYDCILNNYKRLWLSENREEGADVFLNFISDKKKQLSKCMI